ncbi:MAG: hypothetical protein U0792_16720 [Gemmataceae bacterium]
MGAAFLWREDDKPAVFNLGTQPRPGRQRCDAVETALQTCELSLTKTHQVDRDAYRSRLRRFKLERVKALIEAVFVDWPGTVTVYDGWGKVTPRYRLSTQQDGMFAAGPGCGRRPLSGHVEVRASLRGRAAG